jgi:hypothetical protein
MADDKDSTFKDILYQLQVANESMFDNISVLNKIEKLLDVGNMQSLAFQTAEKEGPKTETPDAGDNKEVVAGLSFLADIATSSLKTLNRIDFASDITMQRMVEMTDAAKASSLQALENESEFRDRIDKLIEENAALLAETTLMRKELMDRKKEKPEMSWATWAIAVGAALLGFVEGFVAELAIKAKALFTGLTKLLDFGPLLAKIKGSKFVLTITRAFESIVLFGERLGAKMGDLFKMFKNSNFVTKITEGFTKILDIGKNFGAKVSGIFTSIKSFFTQSEFITDIVNAFKNVAAKFKGVKDLVMGIGKVGAGASEAVGLFGKIFAPFSKFFSSIAQIAPRFLALGKAFGSLAGKLAIPITIILGIWDSITGFIDGFKNTEGTMLDKIVGGLKGGLSKLVEGLIGGLLDMLKGAVSWIAKALGFDGIAAALDSFSFSEILGKLIGNLVDGVVGFFTDQFAVFKVLFDNIKKMFSGEIDFKTLFLELLGGIIRTLLAPVNAIGKLAGFDITKKALSLLGLPDTGRTDVGGTPKAPKVKADAEVKPGENATETNTVTTSTSESISLSDRERLEKEALTSKSALVTNNSILAAPGQVQAVAAPGQVLTVAAPANVNLTPTANLDAPMVGSDAEVLNRYAETAELEAIDSPIVGAEMNALQSDTAQAEAERASTPIVIPAPASGRGGDRKVINNSQAITYNSNNMPDRTGWMLTPQFGY